MHNVNNPEYKKRFEFDNKKSMIEFAHSLNKNPMVKSVNQTNKFGVEVVARDPQTLTKINEMYDTTPVDPKKKMKSVDQPLKGKGYPYNEDDEKNFKPHMMYDPKTGKGYKADTYKDHLRMDKMGYTHTPPKKKIEESLELDEAKTVTLVAKKKGKTLETVKKVSAKERKTVEMLMKTAHGKDVKIEVVKEDVEQIVEMDGVMIRELGLYIANNGDMYRQRIQPIIKNMRRKMSKGIYDEKLAAKGFMHAVTDGIKRYNKEYGAGAMKLSKGEKEEVALILLRDYQDEIREGVNFDEDTSALLKNRIFGDD